MDERYAAVRVHDEGAGIPKNQLKEVFKRFYRAEHSITRMQPGTGLGLSLVAAVARLHQARLTLDDNNPGLKATISFPRTVRRKERSGSSE